LGSRFCAYGLWIAHEVRMVMKIWVVCTENLSFKMHIRKFYFALSLASCPSVSVGGWSPARAVARMNMVASGASRDAGFREHNGHRRALCHLTYDDILAKYCTSTIYATSSTQARTPFSVPPALGSFEQSTPRHRHQSPLPRLLLCYNTVQHHTAPTLHL